VTALSNARKLYRSKICHIYAYISSLFDLMTLNLCAECYSQANTSCCKNFESDTIRF